MNSLLSMILVLSYQNEYRLRRVTDLQKSFCYSRPLFTSLHAHKAEFQILHLIFKAIFTSPLSSVLVSCPSLPF